jgi:hypothetical protein
LATNTGNIAIGVATVSVGAYVTAGGAGSLTDVGHTKGPTTLTVTGNDYAVATEQSFGTIRKVPISATVKVKVMMDEATLDNLRTAFRQASSQLTGSAPNKTLLVGNITEQYHQVQIVTKGTGGTTQATRTITIWRAITETVAEIAFGKGNEQTFEVTFDCLYDDSVATGDKFLKVVDSGGA